MTEFKEKVVDVGSSRLTVVEQGQGPLVVLLHGFPESWYSWRLQFPALVEAGYRVVAPNQRGYAGSSSPESIEDFDIVSLTDDVAALIEAMGESQAVVIGHDWGAPIAWHTALRHPERVRAVGGLSVPYGGRSSRPPIGAMKHVFKDVFFYILYFQQPGVAEAELDGDVRKTLRMMYYSSTGGVDLSGLTMQKKGAGFRDSMTDTEVLPAWLTEADLDFYTAQFERSGFRGPVNWYRNLDRNWERTEELTGVKVKQPAIFLGGSRDPFLMFARGQLEKMPQQFEDLRANIELEGCGHWTQQERPDEVNAALLEFLSGLDAP